MKVETHEFSLPLESALDTAHGPIEHRKGILIRIEDGDDVGIGEATPLPGWTESLPACRAAIAHVDDPESGLPSLESTPAARHGFALALADMEAKRAEQPLYRYLGGPDHVEVVPANATVGDCSRIETVTAVKDAVDTGSSA